MNPRNFTFNPSHFGLPGREELIEYRIWDSHYHGFLTSLDPLEQHRQMLFYIERMGIERSISVEVGGTLGNPLKASPLDDQIRDILENNRERFSGITPIDPGYPYKSCEKMKRWITDGPCIGIKYVGGNELGVSCSHSKNDRIISLAAEMDAVIYIHTWLKVGGSPRLPGGGNNAGESTPMDVAALARRFPEVPLICGHSGGDWELGTRAIRPYENVYFEFAGSDPHAGAIDFAVNELGVDRIVWGGHGPSRSFATELSKVLDASVSHQERKKILGGNYRRLAANIFRTKGIPIDP